MSNVRKLLLVICLVLILAVILLTWGSVGSGMCAMCLLLMGAAMLFRRFVLERDGDDFNMEQ